jgi:hypothetical protein
MDLDHYRKLSVGVLRMLIRYGPELKMRKLRSQQHAVTGQYVL